MTWNLLLSTESPLARKIPSLVYLGMGSKTRVTDNLKKEGAQWDTKSSRRDRSRAMPLAGPTAYTASARVTYSVGL